MLGFTSAGPSTEEPVNIPLHDSELVYVVEQLRPAAFRNLATSLQISDADVNLIPSGDTPHAQDIRTALLFSWRDSQRDFLNARTSLAQSLAHIKVKEARTQQYAQSFSNVKVEEASTNILKGRKQQLLDVLFDLVYIKADFTFGKKIEQIKMHSLLKEKFRSGIEGAVASALNHDFNWKQLSEKNICIFLLMFSTFI